jgi:hypothetical protein
VEPEEPHDSPAISLSESKALIPLLLLFAMGVLGILGALLGRPRYVSPEGAPANHAYGPADFPETFGKDEALTGLEEARAAGQAIPVPAAPLSDGIYPCSACHADMVTNPVRREVDAHSDIVLHHDEENRWCLDCHDAKNRDRLRLASGALIEFKESYKLCGQCHGTQYRDWKVGIHGKRTGYWNGAKRYLLCVHCHSPHSPKFKAMKPFPPPIRPQFLTESVDATASSSPDGDAQAHVTESEAAHVR